MSDTNSDEWQKYRHTGKIREARPVDEDTVVSTIRGDLEAEPGDYLVRDEGEIFPVSGEKFRNLYERVDEDDEDKSMTSSKSVVEVYEDRNTLALAFVETYARLAEESGVAGWYEHDEWAVLFAKLPNGLVSWHVRPEVVPDYLPKFEGSEVFDGHTREEKNDRLREWADGDV